MFIILFLAGLRAHMKMHSEIRPHICDVCGSTFNREPCLAKQKRTHTGERPFACDTCPQKCVYRVYYEIIKIYSLLFFKDSIHHII